MVIFDFILNYLSCRPHFTICLNLVHNKAEEEFSLLEMTAAFLSFGPTLFQKTFGFKISNLFFKMKARTFPSLLNVMLCFILSYFFLVRNQEVDVCFKTLELLLVCVFTETMFSQRHTGSNLYHFTF